MEPTSAYEAGQAFGRTLAIVGVLLALFGGGITFLVAMIKASTRRTRGWIIGALVAGLVTLIGLIGAVGLAASSLGKAIQAKKTSAERKKRVSADGGRYRLEIPGHWREMPALNEEAGIGAGNEAREQYLLVIENPKSDFVGDLDAFDQLSTNLMTANLENPEVSEPERRDAGKYPARHRRVVGTTENIRVAYQISSIESADAFYQVLMWTTPSRETAALPLFREVVDSFSAQAGPPDPKRPAAPGPRDTRSRVTAILVELLGSDAASVAPESRIVEDLGADSLDTVELVMAVEDEFGVAIPDDAAAELRTVGDLIRWLDQQAGEVEE
jgi:acyl carrier protein